MNIKKINEFLNGFSEDVTLTPEAEDFMQENAKSMTTPLNHAKTIYRQCDHRLHTKPKIRLQHKRVGGRQSEQGI